MDQDSGRKWRSWSFPDPVYNAGVLVAYKDTNRLYVLSFDRRNRIKLRDVIVNDDGRHTAAGGSTAWLHAGLGVPRGLLFREGALWLLADDGPMRRLYRLALGANGTIAVADQWTLPGNEAAGLATDGKQLYYATAEGDVRQVTLETPPALRVQAFAPQTMTYVTSKASFRGPIALGAKLWWSGLFPGLWMADLAGNPPHEAANVFGLIPHPNGDPNLLYGRQRQFGTQSNRAYRVAGNVQNAQKYELTWDGEGVGYWQNGQLLGRATTNVPQTSLYVMIGGGTFNANNLMANVYYVYLRKFAAAEPVVTFGETATFASPELSTGKTLSRRPPASGSSLAAPGVPPPVTSSKPLGN
jgi:hypothetical protein